MLRLVFTSISYENMKTDELWAFLQYYTWVFACEQLNKPSILKHTLSGNTNTEHLGFLS